MNLNVENWKTVKITVLNLISFMKCGNIFAVVSSVVLQNDLHAGGWVLHDVSFNDTVICWDFIISMVDEWIRSICGMVLMGENWSAQRKTSPNATFSFTEHTLADLGWNQGLRGEKPPTNCLSCGTAWVRHSLMWSDVWCDLLCSCCRFLSPGMLLNITL